MIRVIAITQFVFLSLGFLALTIIVKASTYPDASAQPIPAISTFLAQYGAWFLLVPVLWTVFAMICQKGGRGLLSLNSAQVSGVILSAAILGVYSYAIFKP
ncbi:MAG: hypothetical protein ABIP97_09030 [Chthoniobacterales bacterium]